MPAPLIHPWFEAYFYSNVTETRWSRRTDERLFTFDEAQGLFLWCPCGFGNLDKDGREKYPLDLSLGFGRPHGVLVPFACRGLPENHGPFGRDGKTKPRWNVVGTSLADISCSPSIAVGPADKECWHGFIKNGIIA